MLLWFDHKLNWTFSCININLPLIVKVTPIHVAQRSNTISLYLEKCREKLKAVM